MAGTPQNYPPEAPPSPIEQQQPPPQPQPPVQQPQYYPQPVYYLPSKKKSPPEKKWLWIGVIGIIIVIIGGIIATIGQSTSPPNQWNYYDKSGNFDRKGYYQDYYAWQNNTRTTLSVGKILNGIGDALVGIMTIGLMVDSKISEEKRKYLLLISAILFGLLMIATMVTYMNTLPMYSTPPSYYP